MGGQVGADVARPQGDAGATVSAPLSKRQFCRRFERDTKPGTYLVKKRGKVFWRVKVEEVKEVEPERKRRS